MAGYVAPPDAPNAAHDTFRQPRPAKPVAASSNTSNQPPSPGKTPNPIAISARESPSRFPSAGWVSPVLVSLYADHDVRAPVAVGEALHVAVRGSELVVLPGPGHVSPVEAPDAVTRELRRFLHSTQRGDRRSY